MVVIPLYSLSLSSPFCHRTVETFRHIFVLDSPADRYACPTDGEHFHLDAAPPFSSRRFAPAIIHARVTLPGRVRRNVFRRRIINGNLRRRFIHSREKRRAINDAAYCRPVAGNSALSIISSSARSTDGRNHISSGPSPFDSNSRYSFSRRRTNNSFDYVRQINVVVRQTRARVRVHTNHTRGTTIVLT